MFNSLTNPIPKFACRNKIMKRLVPEIYLKSSTEISIESISYIRQLHNADIIFKAIMLELLFKSTKPTLAVLLIMAATNRLYKPAIYQAGA